MTVPASRSRAPATRPHRKGFVMLPTGLLYDHRLTGDQMRTWAALDDLQRDEAYVDTTGRQLAAILGCSDDAVERRTKALEECGWLKVSRQRGLQRANRYVVLGSPRRTNAGSGTRTESRTDADSMESARTRVPSVSSTVGSGKKKTQPIGGLGDAASQPACGNEDCDHGWISELDDKGYEQARRCPACHPKPF